MIINKKSPEVYDYFNDLDILLNDISNLHLICGNYEEIDHLNPENPIYQIQNKFIEIKAIITTYTNKNNRKILYNRLIEFREQNISCIKDELDKLISFLDEVEFIDHNLLFEISLFSGKVNNI